MVEGNLTNVQCEFIQNCCNESPLYNEYILIKMKKNNWNKKISPFCYDISSVCFSFFFKKSFFGTCYAS
jgi:hypothetical protein